MKQQNDTSKNKNNGEEISIEIRCPFYNNGCNWCNKQNKLSDHLLYECSYCPNIFNNAFISKQSEDKNNILRKSIENLNDKLANLKINPNDNKQFLKIKTQSTDFDKEVLSLVFNNYLSEDDTKSEKSIIRDKQDKLFEQIIQDYNYNSEDSRLFNDDNYQRIDSSKKLILDTLNFGNSNNDDVITTADINFNNEPLTWDTNSEKDNKAPWSASTSSEKFKERKKYRLSDTNDEVKVKNKKSPVMKLYARKKLVKKCDDSPYLHDSKTEKFYINIQDNYSSPSPTKYEEKSFNSKQINKHNSPSPVPSLSIKSSVSQSSKISSKKTHKNEKDTNDTLSINTQLLNINNDISSIFTPQEIEVLMDVWFKKENKNTSEHNLIFNKNETNFIKQLLLTFDDETKNNLKDFNNKKLKGSSHNLLKSIDNLLAARKNEEINESRASSFINLNDAFSKDFSFNFNFERWNQSRDNLSITKDLNQAFKIQKEKTRKAYSKGQNSKFFF